MASSTKKRLNKSAIIRDALKQDLNVSPKELAARLSKAHGVTIEPGIVSNLKTKMKLKGRGPTKVQNQGIREEDLLGAKELVNVAGGVEPAQKALNLLGKLQA